jgi:putative SOS response-associated peptidase YedK
MCGRITLRTPMSVLMREFEFQMATAVDLLPRYNIAPTQSVAVVLQRGEQRQFDYLRWGLIPSWAKDAKLAASMINARAETVAEKPAFRSAFKSRRCLILADGYYEWLRQTKAKQPYLYEIEGGRPFAMAGLWESWRGPTGNEAPLHTCTTITTTANPLAAEVHDRMPVILHAAHYDAWLKPGSDPAILKQLLVPYQPDKMTVRPVSQFVNNSRNEGEECVAAWE